MPVWLIAAVLAAFLWGIANILDKLTMAKYIVSSAVYVILDAAVGLIPVLLILLIKPLNDFSWENALLGMFTGFAMTTFSFLYSKALSFGDVTVISILIQTIPVFSILIGLSILKERYSFIAYVGMALTVTVSTLATIVNIPEETSSTTHKFSVSLRLLILMLPASILMSISYGVQDYALTIFRLSDLYLWGRIGSIVTVVPLFLLPRTRKSIKSFTTTLSQSRNYKPIALFLAQEVLNLLALLSVMVAYANGPVALVVTAASVQPLFVLAVTYTVNTLYPSLIPDSHERSLLTRFIFILFLVLGIYLMQQ